MNNVTKIFGAPGCGKTTRLMAILETELKQVDPDKIAFCSFTRKGTYEGVQRAQEQFKYTENDLPYFHTLHSIAFRTGSYSKYDMISKADYKEFSDAMSMKFVGYYSEEFFNNDDKYLFLHFLKRNNLKASETFIEDLNFDIDMLKLDGVERNFSRFKLHKKIVDFTDIIEAFIMRDEPLPVEVAIIDEAQDLTTLQWRMCEVAFRNAKRVYVAGDDDQAIYEWNGADVHMFLSMAAQSQEILQQSYRLQHQVLNVAKSISQRIGTRVDKKFNAIGAAGTVNFYNDIDELKVNPDETYYFLSRNNYFLFLHREYLQKNGIVYMDKDKPSVDPRHIKAINDYERARKRGKLTDVEEVSLKLYTQGTIDLSKPWFETLMLEPEQIIYYRDLIRLKSDVTSNKVMLNTIHGVKGGEADNVVLIMDFTKSVKLNMERNPDAELRCLYVAVTRAKKNLHIIASTSKNGYDGYVRMR